MLQLRDHICHIFDTLSTDIGIPRPLASTARYCIHAGTLIGDVLWGEELALKLCAGKNEIIDDYGKAIRAIFKNDRSSLRSLLTQEDFSELRYRPIIESVIAEPVAWTDEAKTTVQTILGKDVATYAVLYQVHITLQLLQIASNDWTNASVVEEFDSLLKESLHQALTWCLDNKALGYAKPFLNRAEILLPNELFNKWDLLFEQLRKDISSELRIKSITESTEGCTLLSMIGTITVTNPNNKPHKVRGSRLRHTLGLLVASQLMHSSLSLAEFRELATGMKPDTPRIDNYFHTILSRLRGLLGQQAIITDGKSAPHLNLEHVSVDLLRAVDLLERCEQAIRAVHPRKAKEAAMEMLQIIGREPTYPTLYNDFFEAARSDFEVRMRGVLFSAIRLMRQEGDLEGATELLKKLLESMPNDEEVAEELIDVLQVLGRSTEAISIRKSLHNTVKA